LVQFNHLDSVSISLRRRYEHANISPQLAQSVSLISLGPTKWMGQVCGELSIKDGIYKLEQQEEAKNKGNSGFRLAHVGAPNWAHVYNALVAQLAVTQVDVVEDTATRTATFTLPELSAELIMSKTETKIRTKNPNSRKLLLHLILNLCYL